MFGGRGTLCSAVAVAAFCVAGTARAQAAPCPAGRGAQAGARISLDAAPVRHGDTVRTVRVCMRADTAMAVGSFHLFIEYDSTRVRAERAAQGPSGTIVANLTRRGRADIAGADPGGFSPGELVSLTFAPLRKRALSRLPGTMVVRLLELNATNGASIVEHAVVTGIGVPVAAAPVESTLTPKSAEMPHIDSLTPAVAKLSGPGGLVAVTIHGSGFRAEGNTVLFAGVEIAQLPSADGTSLHLVLPSTLPAAGEVPPRRIGAGRYEVRVRTSTGTSNPTELTLETPQ
jgi:hypothetical protein